jgi:hypothetical protein
MPWNASALAQKQGFLRTLGPRHQAEQLLGQRRKLRPGRRTARMNHNVPSRSNLLAVQPHDFADSPPDAVPLHRAAQRLFDAPAEPADAEPIGAKKNGELAARPPPRITIHRVVFGAAHQAAGAGKSQFRRVRRA